MDFLRIRGARQHNLQNVSCDIPRNRLVVITGVSGSGKSSLAFDTIYAEGQRRYVESLSAYARQFLEQMEKPDVDSIEGLSPAISIEQRTTSRNPALDGRHRHRDLRLPAAPLRLGRQAALPQVRARRSRRRRSRRWWTAPCACPLGQRFVVLAPYVAGQEGRVQEADGRDGQGGVPARPRRREDGGPRRSARARQAEEAHDRDRRGPARRQGRGRRGVPQAPGRLDRDGGAGLGRAHHPVRGGRAGGGPVGQLRLPRLRHVADRDHAAPLLVQLALRRLRGVLGPRHEPEGRPGPARRRTRDARSRAARSRS